MNKKVKLINSKKEAIFRGEVLRFKAKYPYEEFVDFMVFETMKKDTPYGLMVTSGYKAGLISVYLPKNSNAFGGGLRKNWIISNWKEWIYPDCDISEVYIINGYVAKI